MNDHSVEQHQPGETILIDHNHHENEERRRNQEKLIKEEKVEQMPAPQFPEVQDSMIGIQKLEISKELLRVLQPRIREPLNQEKLIKEEEVEEMPPGIQKIEISEELWRALQPGKLKPFKIHQDL